MKFFIVLVALCLVSAVELSANLRQGSDYKFQPWSLECTTACQNLGGVVCGYTTQICCKSGQCHKGRSSEYCYPGENIHVHLCLPGPK